MIYSSVELVGKWIFFLWRILMKRKILVFVTFWQKRKSWNQFLFLFSAAKDPIFFQFITWPKKPKPKQKTNRDPPPYIFGQKHPDFSPTKLPFFNQFPPQFPLRKCLMENVSALFTSCKWEFWVQIHTASLNLHCLHPQNSYWIQRELGCDRHAGSGPRNLNRGMLGMETWVLVPVALFGWS